MRRSNEPNRVVPGDAVLDQLALRHSELLVLLDESAAMNAVARRIRELGGFDMSLVGRVEHDGAMVHRSWLGTQSTALHRLLVPEGHGLGGKSLLQRRPVWVRDYLASSAITHEFDELVARGVEYTWDECWRTYRMHAGHGLIMSIVGAAITAPTERGDEMLSALINRTAQQMTDLDTLSLF